MSDLKTWFKPDGTEIQINDRPETEAFAESLGWVRKIVGKKAPPKIKVERNKKDLDE
jgi:hypothetical protein